MADRVQDFIDSMYPAAQAISAATGIDPVTIITQSAIETGWGKSAPGNNYFGIKSHGQAGGQNLNTREVINGRSVNVNDSFRTYPGMAESVAGYGDFLQQNPRYSNALGQKGYANQLRAITEAGYATDPKYGELTQQVSRMVNSRIPQVATRLDTGAPNPATPSGSMNAMRNAAGLPSYDSLAFNPVRGNGSGAMQPAPQPSQQSLALASVRAAEAANTSPSLRAALNNYAMTQAAAQQPARTPARIDPVGGTGLSYGMLQDTFPTRTPSSRDQQRAEQALLRGQSASPTQQLRQGLAGSTTPTAAQVNEMYAGGSVFPMPLNYTPPPVPANMSTDMAMLRNTQNLMRQDQVAGGRPIPANMPPGIAAQRANGMGIGGPDMLMGAFPQTQSAQLMLARDPAMAGLIPQALLPQGVRPAPQPAPKPPVGAVLGLARNGGGVVQGFNGLLNSTTQSSDYWRRATGKSGGRQTDGNESLSLGV